jgi:hypothetical protein
MSGINTMNTLFLKRGKRVSNPQVTCSLTVIKIHLPCRGKGVNEPVYILQDMDLGILLRLPSRCYRVCLFIRLHTI